ncbi:CHC2 zinc finger domain-containing protein [uncultured Prevotella sp.]|uniref:CHC2 zinc finger domain-containing protein n=1 Tax=uncultured Prevotella sp. TaxID=159272 RepID=UPI00338DE59C
MDKNELQKLRELPIEGVAERLGLRVVHHKALCPFHADNHPSLSFKVSKNTYRCFVCGTNRLGDEAPESGLQGCLPMVGRRT